MSRCHNSATAQLSLTSNMYNKLFLLEIHLSTHVVFTFCTKNLTFLLVAYSLKIYCTLSVQQIKLIKAISIEIYKLSLYLVKYPFSPILIYFALEWRLVLL